MNPRHILLVVLIMMAAVLLRFWGITRESIWFDEAASVKMAKLNVSEMIRPSTVDTHPPVYHLGLKAWCSVFGWGEAGLRSYSVVWSIVGLLFLFLLAKSIGGWNKGLIAMFLGAINPFDIYYAQETRMYIQWAALGTASSYFLWEWMKNRKQWGILGYIVTSFLLLFTQLAGVAFLAAQGVCALFVFARQRRVKDALIYLAVGLMCGLAFVGWLFQVQQVRGSVYTAGLLGWMQKPPLSDLVAFLVRDFFWGRATILPPRTIALAIVSSLAVLLILVRFISMFRKRELDFGNVLFVLWMLFGPVLIAFIVSYLYQPIYFRPRFCVIVLPYFLICAALVLELTRRSVFGASLAVLIVSIMSAGTGLQYTTREKYDYRALAETIKNYPADGFVFAPGYTALAAQYYLPDLRVVDAPVAQSMLDEGATIGYCRVAGSHVVELKNAQPTIWFTAYGIEAFYYEQEQE